MQGLFSYLYIMKKLLLALLVLTPLLGFSQYVKVSTHYDAEQTAKEIIKGKLGKYLGDVCDLTIEKKSGKIKTKYDASFDHVVYKVYSYFDKGATEYISRTNGGYTFTIAISNRRDDTKILNYCTFSVDAFTQKIKDVEITRGE